MSLTASPRFRRFSALTVLALALCFTIGGSRPVDVFAADEVRAADLHLLVNRGGQWWTVAISMLIHAAAATDFDQAAADAREDVLARFPGAIVLDEEGEGSVGAQYALTPYAWTAGTASWAYDDTGEPISGAQAAIQAGAAIWGQAGSNWSFTGGGSSNAGTEACDGDLDQSNVVGWGAQPGGTLAVTCAWYDQQGRAAEFDMEIDPDWDWTTGVPAKIDLQSVATHEFGHALGLGHSSVSGSVMYASYGSGQVKRTPQQDDINGLIALYGAAAPKPSPTPSKAPAKTPSPVATPTQTPTPRGTLPVLPGANFVAWTGKTATPETALAAVNQDIQVVYGWNSVTRQWERYGPGLPKWVNTLKELKNGDAYWLLATRATAISVR